MLRSRADGLTTEADRSLFAAATPHLLTALRMQRAIHRQGAELAAGALDSMNAIAFLCDAYGKVIALTGRAEAFLRTPDGFRLIEGRLSARRSEDDRRLQTALASTLRDDDRPSVAQRVWLSGAASRTPGGLCELYRMPTREWALGWQARALVTVRTPHSSGVGDRCILQEVFGLTAAEAEVALLAGKGLSREEIAQRRDAAPATVNSQLKSIFGKMDVRREAELVARVNALLR